ASRSGSWSVSSRPGTSRGARPSVPRALPLAFLPPHVVTGPVEPEGHAGRQLGLELELGRRDGLATRGAAGAAATAAPGLARFLARDLAGLDELANAQPERELFHATSLSKLRAHRDAASHRNNPAGGCNLERLQSAASRMP